MIVLYPGKEHSESYQQDKANYYFLSTERIIFKFLIVPFFFILVSTMILRTVVNLILKFILLNLAKF